MPIASKRFSILSDETNIASASFGAGKLTDIINIADNELRTTISSAAELIKSSLPSVPDDVRNVFSSGKDMLSDYSRNIRGVSGKLTDFKNAPESLIKDLVRSVGGGDTAGSSNFIKSAMDVLRRCGKGSSMGYGGRPYNLNANCSGGKASLGQYGVGNGCNSSSMNDLLNKLSGGKYGNTFHDIASALNAFMALTGYGYKLGMCGVFGSLYNSDSFRGLGLGDLEFGKAGRVS